MDVEAVTRVGLAIRTLVEEAGIVSEEEGHSAVGLGLLGEDGIEDDVVISGCGCDVPAATALS